MNTRELQGGFASRMRLTNLALYDKKTKQVLKYPYRTVRPILEAIAEARRKGPAETPSRRIGKHARPRRETAPQAKVESFAEESRGRDKAMTGKR